ncbi:MAG: PilC/PilY family type IV pilus protein, partial [Desulfobacterales bacterium]
MKISKMQYSGLGAMLMLLLHIFVPKRAMRIAAITMLATFCLAGGVNAYLFEDGFESGDKSAWDFGHTQPGDQVQALPGSTVYEGNYALFCFTDPIETGGQAWVTKTFAAQNKLYMRAYFYFDSFFNVSDYVTLLKYAHTNWNNLLSVTYDETDTLYLWNSIAGEAYGHATGTVITKNEWHSIEMMIDVNAGEARLWIDGNLDIEATGVNLGTNGVVRVTAGISWQEPKTESHTLYMDNVVVDTQYIGGGGALSVNPASVSVFEGDDATVSISGGTGPYSAGGYNSSIATASITGTTMTVSGVSAGTTTITVTDADSNSIDVSVTVTPTLSAAPTNVNLYLTPGSDQADVIVSGGQPGYTATSGNTGVATVTISGSTATITGVGAGTVTITITDAFNNHVYVTAVVGDSITPGLGDCPAPPFAQAGVSPNVMIIFDTSGSMDSDDGDGITRFDEAKQALLDFLASNKNIRFGLMRLDGTPWKDGGRPGGVVGKHNAIKGGRVLVPNGHTGSFETSADYIIDYINTHMPAGVYDWRDDTGARHWTNLAETLTDAGRYFATVEDSEGNRMGKGSGDAVGLGYYKEGTDYTFYYDYDNDTDLDPFLASITDDHGNPIDTTSPLQHSCEQAFVIMFTDGQANCDNDWDVVTDVIGDYDGDNDSRDCKRADPEEIRPGISDPNNSEYGMPLDGAVYPCDTRGNPNGDTENGEVEYLDDVAKFLYTNDMRSDIPGMQNVITYTIGFYHDDQLLKDAADNGGGDYFTANSIASLTAALQSAMADILAQVASGTAVTTITTSSSDDDYLIRAKFLPASSWQGYLERYTLPYTPEDPDYDHDWEAGAALNARVAANGYTDRKIYTFLSSQNPKKQVFTSSDGAVKTQLGEIWNLESDWGEVADIINYIRGDQTYDGDKYKDRKGWLLGDIIYSTPISISEPRAWLFGSETDHPEQATYNDFRDAHASRKTMVYVGANDGMLHAFDGDTGAEDWAFIPENLHAKLKKLTEADCHKYFVDLTPSAADVYDGSKWLTVLIGGNRLGGQEYFALDVTDPAHDQFSALWDVIPFNNHLSSTVPAFGKLKADNDNVDNWAAIITSGYHGGSEKGKIAALNIANGNKLPIWIDPEDYDEDEIEEPLLTQETTAEKNGTRPYYSLSSPAVLDSDMDGYIDLIYAGDTEGKLWKFYYDYEADGWKKTVLFRATDSSGNPQAITAVPALAFSDSATYLRIYFGTGRYIEESDKANSIQNAFYCLIDKRQYPGGGNKNYGHFTGSAEIAKSDLGNLTSIVYESDFNHADNAAVKLATLANG